MKPRKSPAPRAAPRKPKIALAMAGGGPLGAAYEIGALTALSEGLTGLDFNRLDIYVGVSAGGILGAGLANGIAPREMCRLFIDEDVDNGPGPAPHEAFDPAVLMRPALAEYAAGLLRLVPGLAGLIWPGAAAGHGRARRSLFGAMEHVAQALPAGVFSNDPLRAFLARQFSRPGRSDDFRTLASRLFLVATDLDSGHAVEFGGPGRDAVPISLAATASSAFPGMFPPVAIGGRDYVDGALTRTLHASIALREGASLVLCLNPLVPYDDAAASAAGIAPRHLAHGGLPLVLHQTIRAVIHSRMEIGMRQYADDYPRADVVLFEPDRADASMFFNNMFGYANRRRLCEHAYQETRNSLWRRRHELGPLLARHGVALDLAALRDPAATLVASTDKPAAAARLSAIGITNQLADTLDDLQRYLAHSRTRW
jgi:predicted acylesterase/phospholipase RssA